MRSLTDQLANYAAYHRDRRNIATHLVGVPMIVLAVAVLLSRPAFELGGFALSPAWLAIALVCAYYLRLDLRLGLLMTALMIAAGWAGAWFAAASTASWLGWGIGLFVVGWIIQFIGHHYEGRKPAFVDDLMGLVVGPLFVTVEVVFALGMRRELLAEIERRVGPTHGGRDTS
jgi:uncharacterized membrane protein YGL010W